MPTPLKQVGKEPNKVFLEEEELTMYCNFVETIANYKLGVQDAEINLRKASHSLNSAQLAHSKFIRKLSRKYKTPFYDANIDVDAITGEVKKVENGK